MALRSHVGDQNGAERMRRSLQELGFTQRNDLRSCVTTHCFAAYSIQGVRRRQMAVFSLNHFARKAIAGCGLNP
jgi:hypothetical protein